MENNLPIQHELKDLVKHVLNKAKEYGHGIDLTVGTNFRSITDWGWQTGDNSYTGGAYGYHNWAVVTVWNEIESEKEIDEIVEDITNQLEELRCE